MQLNKIFSLPESFSSGSLILPQELHDSLPTSKSQRLFIEESRQTIRKILSNADKRYLLIVGPCSIHDMDAALDYATRLKALSQSISDLFFVVMRVYLEKPRTAVGWKGLAFDPNLDGSYEIAKGLYLSRKLLLALADLGVPAATEFLEPAFSHYYEDLIAWGCVGARTTESQTHRQMASGFTMPIGFKNNTSGNIEVAVNGIFAASSPHTFVAANKDGILTVARTLGNPCAHLMLRGGIDRPNYDPISIAKAITCLKQANIDLGLLVDCSHDNSTRQHEKQSLVFQSVLQQIIEGNKLIKGLSLESHINEGSQPFVQEGGLKYGLSITDSCMGWDTTQSLIKWGYSQLKNLCCLLLFMLAIASCTPKHNLSAFSEYVTREQLASYMVGTPDPALNSPTVGQKLYINWSLPEEFKCSQLTLKVYMRFKDRTEDVQIIPLSETSGIYVYALLNEDYFEHKGFLTYKIELLADGELIKEWRHQMWVDLITFPKNEADEELGEREETEGAIKSVG